MSNFLGSHAINMDAKGRLAIPTKLREELAQLCGGRIVLTASANTDEERCVLLYPEPEWEVLRPKIEALPNIKKPVRRLQRLMLGNAAPMELDSAGRILVPPTLRSYAYLEKKLMLIGQGNKWELWSEERWVAWLDESSDDDDVPPEMEALSL
ncbi:transcriptional regulator MraZ [Marinobacter sp. JH2]|uniref:division/cell wall cluster transcriptional repressor MraZ n=1 Tax=Marinobacter sp. AL4B TaxID=2871173 RepID=UPI001056B830|nr:MULTISPECIES: division/cell wall cluster transcriptional repressor MraZ [unclassified Marinobacter]MBZ0334482.1 division/cell wall cluster transcriptional repressor MraZ [Marinobacter sp. AL4B]QBM18028.1 transcriptional regulator MraZ [Marinobacter sp. JH2]